MPLLDPTARRAYTRAWRIANKSRVRAYNTAYRKKHARKDYDKKRFQLTGVTPEQFKAQLKKQCGRCALCLRLFGKEAPHADHDHVTKVFRGIIHRNCNVGLGYFKDDTRLLKLAIEYLNKFKDDSSRKQVNNVRVPPIRYRVQRWGMSGSSVG